MDVYQETVGTFDKLASQYQDKYMAMEQYRDTYLAFCQALAVASPRVLELGCGPGNVSRHLMAQCPDMQLLGTDLAPNMVSLARQNVPGARFEIMDARDLGRVEPGLDGIMAAFCLPYLSPLDAQALIVAAAATLRERGVLYLSTMEGLASQSGFQTSSAGDRVFTHYHQGQQLQQWLAPRFELLDLQRRQYDDGSHRATDLFILARKRLA
ncbi:trans-aconitate 2-methyltransferase [Ferrimonas sp. SCSIO 43195]|uniref:class I SAM-dependent methyltransferase n=1 Tax=Ferrimonas sp. SCSIO 43195 TaxID=2822844 RepID=UPI00207548A8|nr:class I SAM-dependent methyltransferase [Ferrimonas sp. SCSIO 43195]USD39105.1 methyltransferase domain-containing protein [Ferrimonas sp. SCSIO 43195]